MTTATPPQRAAIYARISLDATGEEAGVRRQLDSCRAYIVSRGWTPAGEYVDNSVSATSEKERPEYTRMLEDAAAERMDIVIAWKMDRISRQPIELERWITLHKSHGVNLATVDGMIDLSKPEGVFAAGLLVNVARMEVALKGARQRAAHDQRAKAGKPWATRRPFGFLDGGIDHHPVEAPLLRESYRMLVVGESQSAIARWLTTVCTTTVGNTWSQSTVRNMLLNPRNAGLTAHNGVVVGPGIWEPIVPEDTWQVAVSLMTTGKQTGGGAAKYLLTGVAVCGVCGSRMRTAYTSRGVRLYTCTAAQHVSRDAEHLEAHIDWVMIARLSRLDTAILTTRESETAGEDLVGKAAGLRSRLDTLPIDYADGILDGRQVKAATVRILEQLAIIERQLADAEGASILTPLLAAANVETAWGRLSVASRRKAISLIVVPAIMPTGRGSRYNPASVELRWRE